MPDVKESLQERDFGFLRIIAELWGIELRAPDARSALQELIPSLLDQARIDEVSRDLSDAAQAALSDLLQSGGRLPWSLFVRRYGAVREMGPARRDRERPYLQAPSATEALWYRGIISRAFFDAPTGVEEYAFIPDDMILLFPPSFVTIKPQLGRPASPREKAFQKLASDWIVDDACTYLAALRMRTAGNLSPHLIGAKLGHYSTNGLHAILEAAGLLDSKGLPVPEPSREFLEAERANALLMLVNHWKDSIKINELSLVPGILIEGENQNNPLRARQAVLTFLSTLPDNSWWSLTSFTNAIRQHNPDFQRPAGDYDSWFIKDSESGTYLRGFEHWESVDGAYLRFMLCGPMHWLGLIDLASSSEEASAPVEAFRMSTWSKNLLNGDMLEGLPQEDKLFFIRTDGVIQVSRYCQRSARYQLARFCRWEKFDGESYRYQLTTQSLAQAGDQGLRVSHLMTLLRRFARNIPPSLVNALERWEKHGVEAHLQQGIILKLSSPEILQALRGSPTARLLGDPLGTTAVIVKPGAIKKVLSALAEMGYLGEVDVNLLDNG